MINFRGRALNEYGGPQILPNSRKLRIRKLKIWQTDFGCKDPMSKGKQPRLFAKVFKFFLSDKGA